MLNRFCSCSGWRWRPGPSWDPWCPRSAPGSAFPSCLAPAPVSQSGSSDWNIASSSPQPDIDQWSMNNYCLLKEHHSFIYYLYYVTKTKRYLPTNGWTLRLLVNNIRIIPRTNANLEAIYGLRAKSCLSFSNVIKTTRTQPIKVDVSRES